MEARNWLYSPHAVRQTNNLHSGKKSDLHRVSVIINHVVMVKPQSLAKHLPACFQSFEAAATGCIAEQFPPGAIQDENKVSRFINPEI